MIELHGGKLNQIDKIARLNDFIEQNHVSCMIKLQGDVLNRVNNIIFLNYSNLLACMMNF